MQLLLLHPPRNVYVACEHRCVRAHPPSVPCVVPIFLVKRSQERLTCSATRRARECSAHTPPAGGGTGWFGWTWTGHRCRPRALDHARTHQRPPCARGRGDRSNYQCPPRQRDVPANASVKHSHPVTCRLLARGVGLGVHFRVQTRSDPVAPRLFQRCGGSSFSDLGTHAGSSALLRRYRDRRCISSANCRLVPSDRFASVVGCM